MVKDTDTDKVFLETLVKALVDHPEAVQVERKIDELGVLLNLKVHHNDMGVIIGKRGMTAKAIRHLVRVVGFKNHARVNLRIEEPVEGEKRETNQNKKRDLEF